MPWHLNPFKKGVERGLRRGNAEARRPFQQALGVPTLATESGGTESLYGSSLPEGQIRLLEVLGVDESLIYCELKIYEQHLAPRYDAISYRWAIDTTPATVVCNGFGLKVRRPVIQLLETCLRRDLPSRPIWIDAICLNQDNSDEKAVQVPRMAEIYRQSARTIIWLGEPDCHTEDTIIWIKTVIRTLQKKSFVKSLKTYGECFEGGAGLDEYGAGIFGEEDWSAKWQRTSQYLSRPWFRRLWTVQEIVLSSDVHIMCGTPRFNMIPWKDLSDLADELNKVGGLPGRLTPEGFRSGHGTGLSQTIGHIERARATLRRTHLSMDTITEFCSDRECTEPVDRIWGCLGLMSPRLIAGIKDAKIIDCSDQAKREYWKSYIAFAKVLYACERRDFFQLIFGDIGRGRTSPVPTWCVDFNAQRRYSSWQTFRFLRAGFTGSKDRDATNSSLDEVTNTLGIEGFIVDSVAQVTTELIAGEADERSEKELSLWLRECSRLQQMAKYDTVGVASTKALCSTLFAVDQQAMRYSCSLLDAFTKLLEWQETSCHGEGPEAFESRIPEADFKAWRAAFGQLPVLVAACDNRRAFVTQRGHLGLGPPGLQAGDHICVFLRAGPMFALRQSVLSPGCFELIGDAYMYEMMFGEAFNDPGRAALRTFDLI